MNSKRHVEFQLVDGLISEHKLGLSATVSGRNPLRVEKDSSLRIKDPQFGEGLEGENTLLGRVWEPSIGGSNDPYRVQCHVNPNHATALNRDGLSRSSSSLRSRPSD